MIAPLCLLLLCNFVVFATLARSMSTVKVVASQAIKKRRTSRFRSYIGLTTLLGLTWASGLLLLVTSHVAVQWIFTILVSTQGFFIFVLQIATHRLVKKHLSSKSSKATTGRFSSTPSSWAIFRMSRFSQRCVPKRSNTGLSSLSSNCTDYQKARKLYLERLNSATGSTGVSSLPMGTQSDVTLESRQSNLSIPQVQSAQNGSLDGHAKLQRNHSHLSTLLTQGNAIPETGDYDVTKNGVDTRSNTSSSRDPVVISPTSSTPLSPSYLLIKPNASEALPSPGRPSTLQLQPLARTDSDFPPPPPPEDTAIPAEDEQKSENVIYAELDFGDGSKEASPKVTWQSPEQEEDETLKGEDSADRTSENFVYLQLDFGDQPEQTNQQASSNSDLRNVPDGALTAKQKYDRSSTDSLADSLRGDEPRTKRHAIVTTV